MLDVKDNAILCDFGISSIFEGTDDIVKNTEGSVKYFAPEIVRTGVEK
jgi:serine/threonine protein kinase